MPTTAQLRVLRVFRILKTEKYTFAFASVRRVVWYNREILTVALFIGLILILTTSTVLYYVGPEPGANDGDSFESIPATAYLAVLMLTGQGT